MSRLRTFFLRESDECLSRIREEVAREPMDAAAVYQAVRHFRGSAQMARLGSLADRSLQLEERLRPYRAAGPREEGAPEVDESLRQEVRKVLESLETDVEAVREGRLEGDPRMEAGMQEQGAGAGAGEGGGEGTGVVPIDTLEYRGESALERALELRPALENAIGSDEPAGSILDELFDLIRLGRK